MIQVSKLYFNPPDILVSDNCKNKISNAIKEKNKHKFGYYYNHKEVVIELKKIYNEKCAYCESKVEHIATLEVEHYRPKAKVDNEVNHYGYYWLGYEWSNLLLACPKCNGKGGKGNKFPIDGVRTFTDSIRLPHKSPLFNEKPLLLNPELDNPREHFIFDEYGKIEGISVRGRRTIKICKLDRKELNIERRKEIIEKIMIQIKRLILAFESKESMPKETFIFMLKKIFQELEERQNSYYSYTLFAWYMYGNFDKFVSEHLEYKFNLTIIHAWRKYRRGNL
jgi:uncharacterized protein (TIGR02646 family)